VLSAGPMVLHAPSVWEPRQNQDKLRSLPAFSFLASLRFWQVIPTDVRQAGALLPATVKGLRQKLCYTESPIIPYLIEIPVTELQCELGFRVLLRFFAMLPILCSSPRNCVGDDDLLRPLD
jgi:hypothetical protein